MSTVPIPAQYAAKVTSNWNKFLYAKEFYSPAQAALALQILWVWLNQCNIALGHPTVTAPWPDPPAEPAIETVDDEPYGEATGNLVYDG